MDFHGREAIVLRNGAAEVVVVPALGRVMQFSLLDGGGPFWGHPALSAGPPPNEDGWVNPGGDKVWPAPQSDWEQKVGKGWPPPATFDAVPHGATAAGGTIELTSPVDPAYGCRVRRRVTLDPAAAVMTIETAFEKVEGRPVRVAVWSITQLVSPERIFVRLPERSAFPDGHAVRAFPTPPAEPKVEGRLLSIAPHPTEKTLLGSDGEALLWVGQGPSLLIENQTARGSSAAWPDGFHSQIYTSAVPPERYVELELFERLHDLAPGDAASMTARYTLIPRQERDAAAEARRVLG